MAVTEDPRTGLKVYSSGTDPHPTRIDHNQERELIAAIMAMVAMGTTPERPASGKWGRFFWDKDVARLYFDDGAAWKEVTTNGGGGAGQPVIVAGEASEGTSGRSARADHTHSIPLATMTAPGAMSVGDKVLLENASSGGTPNQLVKADAGGRYSAATPSIAGQVANKGYVDAQRETRAPKIHTHDADQVTAGIFNPLRLPVVTVSAQGAMLAADKQKLDNASSSNLSGTIVVRDGTGRAHMSTPTLASHISNKAYVDSQASWNNISGKPSTFAPEAHNHDRLVSGSIVFDVGTDGSGPRVTCDAVYNRTYGSEPNMYVTQFGTIGRSTIEMARKDHSHSFSSLNGEVDSSQIKSLNSDKLFSSIPLGIVQGSAPAWNRGPGSTYNTVVMRPDGTFCEFPSAAKFKQDIEEHVIDPERIYSLPPTVEFAYRQDPENRYFGVIADRWADALPELIGTEEDGKSIHNFHYEKMGVALVPAVQDLNTRLSEAEATVAAQAKQIDVLTARLDKLDGGGGQ